MNKILSVVIVLLLSNGTVLAQEQEKGVGTRITEWLKGLKHKISLITPKKVIPVSTGVAGVRGAKEDEQVTLYWKGKKSEEAVSEEELAEFKKALESVETGDSGKAVEELEKFMKKFPDSALIPDAKKTLDIVKAEPAAPEVKEEIKKKKEENKEGEKKEPDQEKEQQEKE